MLQSKIISTFVLLIVLLAQPTRAAAPPGIRVQSEPKVLVNGEAALFTVKSMAKLKSLQGRWLDHDVTFSTTDSGRTWIGLAGTGLATAKGIYSLKLQGTTTAGQPVEFARTFRVIVPKRKTVVIKVEEKFVKPDPAILERVAREKEIKAEAFRTTATTPLWSGPFALPLDTTLTEIFGVRRVFNGELKSEHKGVDFRAPAGTPVAAANSGTVILAKDLFYEGNCVVVDHGQGLLTIYMHLSDFKVHEGEQVRTGQIIGESGATGRATGPHLHVSVLWRGVPLDLISLTKLHLPKLQN